MEIFSKEINTIVKEILSFETLTEIQKIAVSKIKEGHNVLIVSPTGSGKTEAVMLPLLEKIIKSKNSSRGIKILYITPLKALNRDLFSRFIRICDALGISVDVRHGDTTAYQRRQQLKKPPMIMITTPETLQAILAAPKMRLVLKGLAHVVIDEIHELVSNKRGAQLSIALERLEYLTREKLQRIGLSATVSNPELVAQFLVGVNRPVYIAKASKGKDIDVKIDFPKPTDFDFQVAKKINIAPNFLAMIRRILEIGKRNKGTLCFVNTRSVAELISSRINLLKKSESVGIHHSSISKEHRVATELAFKKKEIKLIISTSSLELGIDIGHIEQVIQIGSPRTVTRLVQRVGRAQHKINNVSKGLIIADSFDDIVESLAIIQHAKNNKIEATEIYYAAYDVLAHQIAGLLLEYNHLSLEQIFRIIKKAYPYRNIEYKELEEIADFLSKSKIIFKHKDLLTRKRATREYYYDCLSTIPDTKQYKILNSSDNRIIGVLDEEFVINKLSEGTQFIVGGKVWQVLEIKENLVIVSEATENSDTEIAHWVGENIPVPYAIAQDSIKIRGKLIKIFESQGGKDDALSVFSCLFPSAAAFLEETVRKCCASKEQIQTNPNFLLEREKNFVVLNTGLGTKGNNTLALLLANLLATRIGTTIPYASDSYRIFLKLPITVSNNLVIDTLLSVDIRFLDILVYKILENTNLFYWRLFNVLKRFGLLKKEASLSLSEIKRYYRMVKNPILVKETLNEIVFEKLDIPLIKETLKKIKSGDIKIIEHTQSGFSLISKRAIGFIFSSSRDYENITQEIVEKVYERLLSRRVVLTCMSCGNWSTTMKIKNVPNMGPKCPKCGSRLIAVTKERDNILQQVYRKYKRGEDLTKEEKKILKNGIQSANLVLSHGRKAMLVLAGKGIGSKTASRVIREAIDLPEKKMIEKIIEYEKQFARTHQFWKN